MNIKKLRKIKNTVILCTMAIVTSVSVTTLASSSMTAHGNKRTWSGRYSAYSYTGATGECSTAWYSANIKNSSDVAKADEAYSASGWAQTPTTTIGVLMIPSFSTHNAGFDMSKDKFN